MAKSGWSWNKCLNFNRNRMIKFFTKHRIGQFIILFFIFHISALGQTTYYVSNSVGDDNTGNGSIDSPFETIGKAVSEIDAG